MERFTNEELNMIATRLRVTLKEFPIEIKLKEPDEVYILLPETKVFKTNEEMAEFAYKTMDAAGIKLHLDLKVSFMEGGKYICTVILHATPKPLVN